MSRFCDSVTQSSISQSSYAKFVANLDITGAPFQFGLEFVGCQDQLRIKTTKKMPDYQADNRKLYPRGGLVIYNILLMATQDTNRADLAPPRTSFSLQNLYDSHYGRPKYSS